MGTSYQLYVHNISLHGSLVKRLTSWGWAMSQYLGQQEKFVIPESDIVSFSEVCPELFVKTFSAH